MAKSGEEKRSDVRSLADLERAVKAVAGLFNSDAVVVIGSQSALVGWPDAPRQMRTSREIDVYPANLANWQETNKNLEASEYINASLGEGSLFHRAHNYYIDGVDENTALLPVDWKKRAVFLDIEDGSKTLTAIAPSTEDIVVSKLYRLAEKDKSFISSHHLARPLDISVLKMRLASITPDAEIQRRAEQFLDGLLSPSITRIPPKPGFPPPPFPADTHVATWSSDAKTVAIREIDARSGLPQKIGNTLGPAVMSATEKKFAIGGARMSEEEWALHPDVVAAQSSEPKP